MISLNQTAGNDNKAIFLLRIATEGSNLISNSAFGSSTGWTLSTGDWTISGGMLNYTYVDDATGVAFINVSAVSAASYVLDYEVKSVSGTGFTIVLDQVDGFATVPVTDVTLDLTLGKHSIIFQGDSGGTIFQLLADGFGASDSISLDNVKLRLADNAILLGTKEITLTSNTFAAGLSNPSAVDDIAFGIDIPSGGGLGELSGYNFKITRYSSNTKLDGFFNEFYPAYNGGQILSRECQIGIVWEGATNYTDITWLLRGRIIDYQNIDNRNLNLTIIQTSELQNELPYYVVQDEFDNGVSYYDNAPDESYGLPLNIVYGDFTTYRDDQSLFRPLLFPLLLVEKDNLRYNCGSHKFDTQNWDTGGGTSSLMYQFVEGVRTYMTCICANGSAVNNDIRGYVTNYDTLNSTDNIIIGTINIHPTVAGSQNAVTDFTNAIDDDSSTTLTIDEATYPYPNGLYLKIDGGGSPQGILSRQSGSILLEATVTAVSGTTPYGYFAYYNPEYNSGTGGLGTATGEITGTSLRTGDISSVFTARDASGEPWRWDELMGLEFALLAGESGDSFTISDFWIRITNIIVNDFRPLLQTRGRGSGRLRNTGGRG